MIDATARFITFGKGDVGIGVNMNSLVFYNFRPAQECGALVDGRAELLDGPICFSFGSFQEVVDFDRMLNRVEVGDFDYFKFKDWTFSFVPRSERSIAAVRTCFKQAWRAAIALYAC